VPVNCVLNLNGVLRSPTISFDLELPNSNEELERKRLANEASKAGHLKKKQQKAIVLSEDEQAFENWFNKTVTETLESTQSCRREQRYLII
jgi:hypothetical protein